MLCCQVVEPPHHSLIVVQCRTVDGEHAGGVADPEHMLSRQGVVDIAGQGGQVGDARNMLFAVQHRLIEVGDAPPLGDIKGKSPG